MCAGQEPIDTHVLVEFRPMNSFAATDKAPSVTLGSGCMKEGRLSRDWDSHDLAFIQRQVQVVDVEADGYSGLAHSRCGV